MIADPLGLPVEPSTALKEYDIGAASGLTGPEVRERFPGIIAAFRRGERPTFPGEEGRAVFLERVASVLDALRDTEHTVVAVAHGGVIGALCYAALGLDYSRPGKFRVGNCSITEIIRDRAGRFVVHRVNDNCHLGHLSTEEDRG